jgi:uncharacterized protein YndB with AHSA1/START domain
MGHDQQAPITVQTTVRAPVAKVWECWTLPEHVMQWNNAADTWHTPSATNDLRAGGSFVYRMEARDGSFGFDFGGTYDEVISNQVIRYTLGDGRKVSVRFEGKGEETKVEEVFEPEGMNPPEMQKTGWQAILDNFKRYTEGN